MKKVLLIDTEELLDIYFWTKYKAKVNFDGEYLYKGRDYSELIIPSYEVTEDNSGDLLDSHEVVLEEE